MTLTLSGAPSGTYLTRRGELQTYFDQTAAKAWERLTSDAPVSGIRATVRAGRDQMRATLLSWLPNDLSGRRVLDAGCGTGALAVAAAARGADVTAIDLSPTLVNLARARAPAHLRIDFRSGDMLGPGPNLGGNLGPELGADLGAAFDYVVGMDSLIHYAAPDMVRVLAGLAARATESVIFTFAPRTPLLAAMHAAGRLFPRRDRAPAIEPIRPATLRGLIAGTPALACWRPARTLRIDVGFYKSEALELVRS